MHAGRILVVDDEVTARTILADLLRGDGYEVETAADAFKALGKCESFGPHVVVTDLQMPGMDGLELLRKIRATSEPAAVILMTAFGQVAGAVEAMRAGATHYLTKPLDYDALQDILQRTFKSQHRRIELRQPDPSSHVGSLVGTTPAMLRIIEVVEQTAPSRASVLITGDAGTGKDALANAIHQASPRRQRPFVKLHCGEPQLEGELFGYERGALPGLIAHKDGRLVHAQGATLFLDEVAALSPGVQIKLLRLLEDQQFERIGGKQTIRVDVRVIAATRRDLAVEVAAGRFREDLFYRLRVVAIAVPPLRERTADIPKLAKLFLRRYAAANTKLIEGLSPEALDALEAYSWPGNVRELENAMESAVVLTKTPRIDVNVLPTSIKLNVNPNQGPPRIPGSTMADIERYAIVETLQAAGGSTSKAAEILGISTRTVQYRLHQIHEAERSALAVVGKPAPKRSPQ
jgi:two-component system, NtrC family, response regulator AtoC